MRKGNCKKTMKKKFKSKITAGMLLLLVVLSIFFSTGVFAANEVADKTATAEIGVAYRGHVQNQGNMPKPAGTMVAGPEALGTRGQSLRVEGFWIELTGNVPKDANIVYEVHVQNEGWMKPEKNGVFAGTTGESERVESIKIRLENLPGYDVYYRGHVQNVGDIPQVDGEWGWKKNGEELGTTGSSLRLEELQVKIVKQPDTTIAYNKAGTYGPKTGVEVIENDVSINTPDVVLQNLHIKGNLTIGEGVGEGDVTLNNITVDGETYVRGGGKNSIHINGGEYNKITIQQTSSGQVRIVATNAAGLEVVVSEDAKGEDIILEGDFENVQIDAPDVKISTQGDTSIKQMVVGESSTGSEITLDKDTTVNNIDLNSSVDMKGEGTIEKANVNSDDVTFEQKPVEETVAPEVKVPPVVTPPAPPKPTEPTPTGPSTVAVRAVNVTQSENILTATTSPVGATVSYQWQKSDTAAGTYEDILGAISSTYEIADSDIGKYIRVTTIGTGGYYIGTVTSAPVPLKTIYVTANNKQTVIVDSTLQVSTTIKPSDLTDKSITWTVANLDGTATDNATISDTGLLTGKKDGMVVVTAINAANAIAGAIELKVVTEDQAVELDSIAAYTNSLSVNAYDSTFYVNYVGIDESQKAGLAGYYSDAIIELDRELQDGEEVIVHAFNQDIHVKNDLVKDEKVKLSELLKINLGPNQLSAEQNGSFTISVTDVSLSSGIQVIVTPIITKAGNDTLIEGKTSSLYIHPKLMKAYFDSVNIKSGDSKYTENFTGGLAPEVVNLLAGYSSDVEIYLTRELQDGEKIKVNGKTITNVDMAKGIVGRIINLSTLLNSKENSAINEERSYDIKIDDISLNSGLYVVATPILTKNNEVIRENSGTGLEIFTAGMKTYADSLEFTADKSSNKFTINYRGVTPQISGLSGYYSDVTLYLDRLLVTDESITLTLTGTGLEEKSVTITKEKLAELDMQNQWINLSKLMDLPLKNANLAKNKKGTYELTVGNITGLKTNLNLSISPVLTTIDYNNSYLDNIEPYKPKGANICITAGLNQQAPTGLIGVAPTIPGGNDGKITGTNADMEYYDYNNEYYGWSKVTGAEITDLIPGTYAVRYAAKPEEGKNVSDFIGVEVPDRTLSMTSLSATVNGQTVNAIDLTGTKGKLFVVQNSKTSAITVEMSEAVTVTPGATVKMPGGITDYGTIALDPNDATHKTITITPIGSNGTAGILGTFDFTVAADLVKGGYANGNALTTITLTVVASEISLTDTYVQGYPVVGQPLTANVNFAQIDGYVPLTATYQWQWCGTVDGDYQNIGGATESTYTPTTEDIGKYYKVIAVGTGLFTGTVTSNPTTAVMANETTKPTLTVIDSATTRRTAGCVTIGFETSEDGYFYYTFVAHNAPQPGIYTSDYGMACGTDMENRTTMSFVDNNVDLDLYAVVKDRSGNLSDVVKIAVPKYAEPTPEEIQAANEFNEATIETIDAVLTKNAGLLGLDLTNYNRLTDKVSFLPKLVSLEDFNKADIKAFFGDLVARQIQNEKVSLSGVLQIGETETATVTTTVASEGNWYAYNDVVTVDWETGEIQALTAGTTEMGYLVNGLIRCLKTITVYGAATTVEPIIEAVQVGKADVTPTDFIAPQTGETITWSSSAPQIAKVKERTGEITAVAAGDTTISYRVTNDTTGQVIAKGSKTITVQEPSP